MNLISYVNPVGNLPDLSYLLWDLNVERRTHAHAFNNQSVESFTKFDLSQIPHDFLCDQSSRSYLNDLSDHLLINVDHTSIDVIYDKFYEFLHSKMLEVIPHKTIITNSNNFKCPRRHKPWWSDDLSSKWKIRRDFEKIYSRASDSDKHNAKMLMLEAQRNFDHSVQTAKRKYWREQQESIQELEHNDPRVFWQQVNKLGIANERKQLIPNEVVLPDGSISVDRNTVLNVWKNEFAKLYQFSDDSLDELSLPVNTDAANYLPFNFPISINEVYNALRKSKNGKACGYDGIPVDILKNDICLHWMHSLFNYCFENSVIPDSWKCGIINPVFKPGNLDRRLPMNYRGITLTSVVYKIFCGIINNRLMDWTNDNNIIADEQNGFRKDRNCVDHIASLTTIIDTRKKMKKSTFCAFIDFSKAFDHVRRHLLWAKLSNIGVQGKILNCLMSMYNDIRCSVRVNGKLSEWFPVDIGLKQGCVLSPLLFSLYVNDLIVNVNNLNVGVPIADSERISMLLYADDIVLMSESGIGLQTMLNALRDWCQLWKLDINVAKSQVVHFRNLSMPQSSMQFKVGSTTVETVGQYKYLGLVINEFLDYSIIII